MKLRFIYILTFLFATLVLNAQTPNRKLIVGIVVDQMRPDYLSKYASQFSENGFKRLLREGFTCNNTHINYVPTVTAPGHASIYTGTTPKYHGIIENEWFDRKLGKPIYCVKDTEYINVGNVTRSNQTFSPRNLLTTNICDELKLATQGKSKIIAISLKDRGSVLPAGHLADEAYWFDQKTGNFISSTYYMDSLPHWVSKFNASKRAQYYQEQTWDLLLPSNTYINSGDDNNSFETRLPGTLKPVLPYNLSEISKVKKTPYYGIYASPFGNSLLTEIAVKAIEETDLGNDSITDIFAISFSSTDAVGHIFGPQSKELNDVYVRLDRDIARLLAALDQKIDKDNYTLFLTADHGAGEIPGYLSQMNIPAGYIDTTIMKRDFRQYLSRKYGPGQWISDFEGGIIYLNQNLIRAKNLSLSAMENYVADFALKYPGIEEVYTAEQLTKNNYCEGIGQKVQKGFNHSRSGDVILIYTVNWNEKSSYSATHGSPYNFDTHIPLLWFGAGIKPGNSYKTYHITDIAPTIASMLQISNPGSCIGKPIEEVLCK